MSADFGSAQIISQTKSLGPLESDLGELYCINFTFISVDLFSDLISRSMSIH